MAEDHHRRILLEFIAAAADARLAVVSPSHQYPAGVTLSATRRLQLLEWAHESGAWIIEDDYDSYFRYAGRPMSALQGVDSASARAPNVIYVGSFSKTVFPSLRIGFCIVPDALVGAVTNARAVADRNSPIIDQAALTEFIVSGQYDRHLRRLRLICQERSETIRVHVDRVFGDRIVLSPVTAGTHVVGWLKTRAGRNDAGLAVRIAKLAAEHDVVVFPLSHCLKRPARDALVLGFGGLSPRRIASGVEKLGVIVELAQRRR